MMIRNWVHEWMRNSSRARRGRLRVARPGLEPGLDAGPRPESRVRLPYGMIGWGGIVETHWLGGVWSGAPGVFSPFARISSAAREQFPPGIVHQLDVRGYAAV